MIPSVNSLKILSRLTQKVEYVPAPNPIVNSAMEVSGQKGDLSYSSKTITGTNNKIAYKSKKDKKKSNCSKTIPLTVSHISKLTSRGLTYHKQRNLSCRSHTNTQEYVLHDDCNHNKFKLIYKLKLTL